MEIGRCEKPAFAVIGKEGSTTQGTGMIAELWKQANAHFGEIETLASRDDQGNLLGIWGLMSDFSRSFLPWENHFSEGLYLAGVECDIQQNAPEGWMKWIVPGYEYLYVRCSEPDTFERMLEHLTKEGLELAGAVHDFTCPQTGENYMYFPVRKL